MGVSIQFVNIQCTWSLFYHIIPFPIIAKRKFSITFWQPISAKIVLG